MEREAIVERVATETYNQIAIRKEWIQPAWETLEDWKKKAYLLDIEVALTAAGFWELLEAADDVVKHRCLGSKADRPDYVVGVPCYKISDLKAVIIKIKGV